jgi:replicative DNA helicase
MPIKLDRQSTSSIIYDPAQAASLTLQALQEVQAGTPGLRFGIPDVDNYLLPMRPGDLVVLSGQVSNYKSGTANWITKQALNQIKPDQNEVVVKITWEQSVEEDTLSWIAGNSGLSITAMARGTLGEPEWVVMRQSYAKRLVTPLWIVGHSVKDVQSGKRARPRLCLNDVSQALELICKGATDEEHSIKLIVMDYLQRIRPNPEFTSRPMREQIMEAVNQAKDIGVAFDCPVLLLTQVGRDISDREIKLPRLDDGMESANIEQTADKYLSVWYPIKSEKEGVKLGGYPVSVNLLIMGLLKQKMGPAPKTFYLYVDPERNVLGQMTAPDINPGGGMGLPKLKDKPARQVAGQDDTLGTPGGEPIPFP